MKLQRTPTHGSAWRHRRTRLLGRLVIYRASKSLWTVALNRYPGEVIGVFVHLGYRCVSWVWPLRITGLGLTDEQFDRGARALIDEEQAPCD